MRAGGGAAEMRRRREATSRWSSKSAGRRGRGGERGAAGRGKPARRAGGVGPRARRPVRGDDLAGARGPGASQADAGEAGADRGAGRAVRSRVLERPEPRSHRGSRTAGGSAASVAGGGAWTRPEPSHRGQREAGWLVAATGSRRIRARGWPGAGAGAAGGWVDAGVREPAGGRRRPKGSSQRRVAGRSRPGHMAPRSAETGHGVASGQWRCRGRMTRAIRRSSVGVLCLVRSHCRSTVQVAYS